ncbi:glycosyl hydrolase 53 family protein [Cohnella candidum]|uniref:Arabinogalactan endo-beta-1,4-galactanase n=1 Tax=Cohnella candidum TaxID=2674991 RepID=A0A3G3K1T4_9BACL|nr:glycosyl hydrolase 53 family protein [Cohnella candidum]AYQ73719.1 hypothetical protein EAV92_14705 [Cohnella candidum]
MKRVGLFRSMAVRVLPVLLLASIYPAGVNMPRVSAAASETVAVAPVAELQNGQRSDFVMGADVSELDAIQKSGKKFYDTDGTEMNAIQVLKKHGVNYIRLRNWVDPTDAFGAPIGGGNTDLANNIAIAKQAKANGVKVLLDFHYSDFWADPGKQNKPKAWANDTGDKLLDDVSAYTTQVLNAMKAEGVLPDMVQIGNEINGGLLWPDGNNADKAAPLLQRASQAVRAVSPAIQIIIHLAGNSSGSLGTFTYDFDKWTTGATTVDFDIIGISDYPYWHGTMQQNAAILSGLASRYNKPVIVAETAYAWTLQPGDETINNFDQDSAYTAGYAPTPQGQAAMLRDMIQNIASVPGGKGMGLFYWGADWLPGNDTGWIAGQGSGWENQALFDYTGRALPSIDVFNLVRGNQNPPAAQFVKADPALVTVQAGNSLNLPSTVKGQFSDGRYGDVPVTAWDSSSVNLTEPGVYTAVGTINGDPAAAKAVVTVTPAQPPNLIANPGLENGATGWTVSNWSVAGPKAGGSNPHSGSSAIHYWYGSDYADAKVEQTLNGVADGDYVFSAWVMGDALGGNPVPYLYASGFDANDPTVTQTVYAKPAGWANWLHYEMPVSVTSGHVTLGVNVNGIAGAWGDVDDLYFGLPPASSASTQTQPVTAASGGQKLSDPAVLPAGSPVTLTAPTGNSTIYYTLDGSDPGYSPSASRTLVYTGPIRVSANTVLKASASAPGYRNSEVRTLNIRVDNATVPYLVPDGGFEQPNQLGAWTLKDVSVTDNAYAFQPVQNAGGGTVYTGSGFFSYWSQNGYAFTLTQKVTGLANGIYTLSARSAGQTNYSLNASGRAVSDPAAATLTLSASTPSSALSANVLNQGQTAEFFHDIWGETRIPNIKVTDGTAALSFTVQGSAGYWGFLDQVQLEKTADLPQESNGGSSPPPVSSEPPAEVTKGTVTLKPSVGSVGSVSVTVKSADLKSAIEQSSGGIVNIAVIPSGDAKKVQAVLPAGPILSGSGAGVQAIRVDTGLAAVTIDTKLLTGHEAGSDSVLALSVASVDPAALPEDTRKRVQGAVVYDFNLTLDDEKISDFRGHEVTVSVPYALKPGEKPGSVVVYYVDDQGKLETVKNGKYDPSTGRVTFKAKHFSTYAAAGAQAAFKDLEGYGWAADAIEAMAARGAASGDGNGHFRPGSSVTRAEFIALLANLFDLNASGEVPAFKDVPKGAWYGKALASARSLGIVQGRPDGSFGANDPISRQDMAVMAYQASIKLGIRLDPTQVSAAFGDANDIAPYAKDAVTALHDSGIVAGTGSGAFAPRAGTNRAQAAVIVYRLFLES